MRFSYASFTFGVERIHAPSTGSKRPLRCSNDAPKRAIHNALTIKDYH